MVVIKKENFHDARCRALAALVRQVDRFLARGQGGAIFARAHLDRRRLRVPGRPRRARRCRAGRPRGRWRSDGSGGP